MTPNEEDEKIEWKICCSNSSKACIKYGMTCALSFTILLFSMVMIINNPESDNSIYFSLISSIMALYIPQPSVENHT